MDLEFFLSPPGILLCLMGFCAGLVDGVVGGGGLIQLPALFAFLPHLPPAALLGTNKLAMVCGTAYAAFSFSRRVPMRWPVLGRAAGLATAMAFLGAAAASHVPSQWMRPMVMGLVLVVGTYTLCKPQMGAGSGISACTSPPGLFPLFLLGSIGFYDGLFGPGAGSFFMFVCARFLAMGFVEAAAHAKFLNLTTNLASLLYFIPQGQVAYGPTLVLAVCNIGGAYVGTHLALKQGAFFVRRLFILVCGGLATQLGIDIWKDLAYQPHAPEKLKKDFVEHSP